MNIELKAPTARNYPFLKFLYEAVREGYSVIERDYEDSCQRLNLDGREHLSTWIEWDGKRLFFDLSDHAFLWNLDALDCCDVYFKANLHWGIASKYLHSELLNEHRHKIAPFLLFAPDLAQLNRTRWLYRLAAFGQTLEVCQIVGVYRNHIQAATELLDHLPAGCNPDAYHFWVRYLTHRHLSDSRTRAFTRLTSKGQPEQEDGLVIYPSVNKYAFFQKIAASRFQFVNILPHALLPWKATEGFALDVPLILDHAPLMEQPVGFELSEGDHYLSLFGKRFDFDATAAVEDPASYRILEPIPRESWRDAFEILLEQVMDPQRYAHLKQQVQLYRKTRLTSANLCKTLLHYLGLSKNPS